MPRDDTGIPRDDFKKIESSTVAIFFIILHIFFSLDIKQFVKRFCRSFISLKRRIHITQQTHQVEVVIICFCWVDLNSSMMCIFLRV